MRLGLVAALALMIVVAGCGGFGGPANDATPDTEIGSGEPTMTATSTPPPPDQGNGDTALDTVQETTVSLEGEYGTELSTGTLLPSQADVPTSYELDGETQTVRETATGNRLAELTDREAVVLHERAFMSSDDDGSGLIFASVVVYESPEAAGQWLQAHLSDIRSNDGSVSQAAIATNIETQRAQFQTANGLDATAYYAQQSNVVIYVAVAGEPDSASRAEVLFLGMLADLSD